MATLTEANACPGVFQETKCESVSWAILRTSGGADNGELAGIEEVPEPKIEERA